MSGKPSQKRGAFSVKKQKKNRFSTPYLRECTHPERPVAAKFDVRFTLRLIVVAARSLWICVCKREEKGR